MCVCVYVSFMLMYVGRFCNVGYVIILIYNCIIVIATRNRMCVCVCVCVCVLLGANIWKCNGDGRVERDVFLRKKCVAILCVCV